VSVGFTGVAVAKTDVGVGELVRVGLKVGDGERVGVIVFVGVAVGTFVKVSVKAGVGGLVGAEVFTGVEVGKAVGTLVLGKNGVGLGDTGVALGGTGVTLGGTRVGVRVGLRGVAMGSLAVACTIGIKVGVAPVTGIGSSPPRTRLSAGWVGWGGT
jgi:hypothetical protein